MGETFDGCRLPPGTWFLLNACVDAGLRVDSHIERTTLNSFLDAARQRRPLWRSPKVDKFTSVIEFLRKRNVLTQILARPRLQANPGLPDLFLWRRVQNGTISGQFVEVKRMVRTPRWREQVSVQQREELDFLQELGLKAGVVYLLETAQS